MEIDGSNSRSVESLSFGGFKNVIQDQNLTEKDVSDSLYVNHAEVAWHEMRRAWVGDKSQRSQRRRRIREPITCWNTSYEELLLTTEPFKDPIPLQEMVDFLVDIWIDEGLYA